MTGRRARARRRSSEHSHQARPEKPGAEDERRCAACGRMTTPRERILIAGVPLHLTCALARRRAAKR
jgi:hypothetical protein